MHEWYVPVTHQRRNIKCLANLAWVSLAYLCLGALELSATENSIRVRSPTAMDERGQYFGSMCCVPCARAVCLRSLG